MSTHADPRPAGTGPDVLRAVAEQVATEAAEYLRGLPAPRAVAGAVGTKSSPTDVVTASDAAVERFVRERLAELRPGEPVYGEEGSGAASTAQIGRAHV